MSYRTEGEFPSEKDGSYQGGLMRKNVFLGLSWTLGNPSGAPLDLLVVSNPLSFFIGLYIFLGASGALSGSQSQLYDYQAKVPRE